MFNIIVWTLLFLLHHWLTLALVALLLVVVTKSKPVQAVFGATWIFAVRAWGRVTGWGKILGMVIAAFALGWALREFWIKLGKASDPVVETKYRELSGRINTLFEKRTDKIDEHAPFEEQSEEFLAAKIEREHNRNMLDGLLRPCPASDGWKGTNRKLLDLTDCKKGAGFRLALVDDSQGEVYEASLFFYGRDGQGKTDKKVLVPSGEAPVITAFPVGKGNLAFRISPPDVTSPVGYQLRGRVKFTYEGNADVLELVRK